MKIIKIEFMDGKTYTYELGEQYVNVNGELGIHGRTMVYGMSSENRPFRWYWFPVVNVRRYWLEAQ